MSVAWDVLDAGSDEETRQAGDIGPLISLYEVVKLAYLQPQDQLLKLPNLYASSAWGNVALSLGNHLYVFGERCSSLLLNLELENDIDVIVWLPQGDFIIIATQSNIHCINISSRKILMTKTIPNITIGTKFISGVCNTSEDGCSHITILSSDSKIIRLQNINTEGIIEGLKLNDVGHLKTLEANVTLTVTDSELNTDLQIQDGVFLDNGAMGTVYWATDCGVACTYLSSIYNNSVKSMFLSQDKSQKIIPICCGRYILSINDDETLSAMCTFIGCIIWKSPEDVLIKDMILLRSDEQTTQVLTLVKSKDKYFLQIISIPEFETIYSLEVGDMTCLVTLSDGSESVLFLEPECNSSGVITALKIKSIVDGVPEARLSKLLRKYKFDEAEEFCGTFGLDVEEVHKAKSRYLCDLINPWRSVNFNTTSQDSGTQSVLDTLIVTLGRIKDAEFVTNLCVEAPLPDIGSTKLLLNYAKERLSNTTQTSEGDHLSNLMQKVSETSYHLKTFETIFPQSDIQHWLAFTQTDMLEEFVEHLSRGNLDVAATVWHRHQYSFVDKIDEECVLMILNAVPLTLHSSVICSWLPRNLIPDLVKLCPASIEIIAAWTEIRVKKLEVLEQSLWPTNGLDLANTIISVLETVTSDFSSGGNIEIQMAVLGAQWKAYSPDSALYHLRHTALALQRLEVLAKNYRIKIAFNQYIQDDKNAVVVALLDWLVSGEDVEPLMEGFLRSFMLQHGLECDEVLSDFVTYTLSMAGGDWWSWQEAPWEDKLYAIINIVTDSQIKVTCILNCIKVAPVPWSSGTKSMCDIAISLNTKYNDSLHQQKQLVALKLVLQKYSLHLISIDRSNNADRILKFVMNASGDSVLEDGFEVINAFPMFLKKSTAYFYRLTYLLCNGHLDEAKTVVESISEDHHDVCQLLVTYTIESLQYQPLTAKCREKRKAIVDGMIALEMFIKKWSNTSQDLDKYSIDVLRRISCLQNKYDIYLTLTDLNDRESCKELLENELKKWISERNKAAAVKNDNTTQLERTQLRTMLSKTREGRMSLGVGTTLLCNDLQEEMEEDLSLTKQEIDHLHYLGLLLNVPRGDVLSLLVSHIFKTGQVNEALQFCRLIAEESSTDKTKVTFDLITLLLNQWKNKPKMSQTDLFSSDEESMDDMGLFMNLIYNTASLALTTCHPSMLPTLGEVCLWSSLGSKLLKKNDSEIMYNNTHEGSKTHTIDPYTTWTFSPIFQDVDNPLTDRLVSEAIVEALQICLSLYRSSNMSELQVYRSSSTSIFQTNQAESFIPTLVSLASHLKDRSQDMLSHIIQLIMTEHKYWQNSDKHKNEDAKPSVYPTSQQIFEIIQKIVGAKKCDYVLCIGLLTLLTKKSLLKVLNELVKKFGYDYARLQHIAKIGMDCCVLQQLSDVESQFLALLNKASWGKRLSDYNISFKEAFKGDSVSVNKVLKELLSHPSCTFAVVYDFCKDFSFDTTETLILYLKLCIHSWSPEPSTQKSKEKEVVITKPPPSLLPKCQNIITQINNKEALKDALVSELEEISYYNYEMIKLILDQLTVLMQDNLEFLKRGQNLLKFLFSYKRQQPPQEQEKESWLHKFTSKPLPLISHYRLPFHPLYQHSKPIKIIEAELDVKTSELWLQVASTIGLNSDQLCFYATQNTVERTLDKKLNGEKEWQICSKHNGLLKSLQTVICQIENNELATACTNWVVNHLPPGKDKVNASKKCTILAHKWLNSSKDDKATVAVTNFTARHTEMSVVHILHKYDLATPEYVAKCSDPMSLIFEIYKHPCLESLATLSTQAMPDINMCISEICITLNINQESIQHDLLEKWLPPSDSNSDVEETITNFQLVLNPDVSESNDSKNDNLLRVIYLLRSYPQKQAVSFLLNCALSTDVGISSSHKLRALQCLLAIADHKTIKECSNLDMQEIRSKLQTITYVSRLESIGMRYEESQFNNMDKNVLVEGLWRSHRHNPQALLLLTDICHDYKITKASLWSAVLTQITNLNRGGQIEISTLERVLMQVKNLPHLWVIPSLVTAWTTLILHPFKKATKPVSDVQLSACVHSTNLFIQHCPVVIQTTDLLELSHSLGLFAISLAIAAADQTQTHNLLEMATGIPNDELIQQYEASKEVLNFPRGVEEIISQLQVQY